VRPQRRCRSLHSTPIIIPYHIIIIYTISYYNHIILPIIFGMLVLGLLWNLQELQGLAEKEATDLVKEMSKQSAANAKGGKASSYVCVCVCVCVCVMCVRVCV
jgi:hypothetical protein